MMIKQCYTVSFVTPAFLGDAEQNGAWRTPPFKALLRQWWRVAAAKDHDYNYAKLREAEGRLFGNAWLDIVKSSMQRAALGRLSETTQLELGMLDYRACILGASAFPLLDDYSLLFIREN